MNIRTLHPQTWLRSVIPFKLCFLIFLARIESVVAHTWFTGSFTCKIHSLTNILFWVCWAIIHLCWAEGLISVPYNWCHLWEIGKHLQSCLVMVGSRPNWEESVGSQHQDHFLNLERMRDHEVSVHTTHTSWSHSRTGSYVLHGEETRNIQLEIDHLRRKLCHKQRMKSPSSSGSE